MGTHPTNMQTVRHVCLMFRSNPAKKNENRTPLPFGSLMSRDIHSTKMSKRTKQNQVGHGWRSRKKKKEKQLSNLLMFGGEQWENTQETLSLAKAREQFCSNIWLGQTGSASASARTADKHLANLGVSNRKVTVQLAAWVGPKGLGISLGSRWGSGTGDGLLTSQNITG